MLKHPESDMADGDLRSIARCGSCAVGEAWWWGETVGAGVGVKVVGMAMVPMRVERVLSVHAGLRG